MKTSRSQGFTIIEGLLVVVVVAVLGGVGYVAYNSFVLQKSGQQQPANSDQNKQSSNRQLSTELQGRLDKAEAQPTPELKTPEDLTKAVNTLKDQSAFDTNKEAKQMNDMAAKFLKS